MQERTRHRASAICVHKHKVLCVRLLEPKTGRCMVWLPGGEIEAGETVAAAAVRETREETGYTVTVDAARALPVPYTFQWNGRRVPCHTTFFPADLTPPDQQPDVVDDEAINLGPVWLDRSGLHDPALFHPDILAMIRSLLPAELL